MTHLRSGLHLASPTAPLTNTSASSASPIQKHLGEVPLPHPIYHSIGLLHRAEIGAWLQDHEPHIGGLVFIFVFLLVLGGLWRSRGEMVQWCFERRKERARRRWVERERMRRRSVVVVGILRRGGGRERKGCEDGKGRVVKRVRFLDLDGVDERETVGAGEERVEVVVDFLEDGRVVGEVF